jgi:ubiquinone/menaquinone biosynthesis C-methylase UbiE
MPETLDGTSDAEREGYAPGYSAAVVRLMQWRTLAGCTPFFSPYLEHGMSVLDCGCGAGSMTLELAARVAPGEVVGLDLEAHVLDRARASAAAQGIGNVRFDQGDIYALPYAGGSFDALFSHALISHLREPARALAEMRRVLKPGGIAAVIENDAYTWLASPSGSAMERFWDLFTRRQRYDDGLQLLPRHLRGALLVAGFSAAEAHAGGEAYGTPEQVRAVAEAAAGQVSSAEFSQTAVEQGWATEEEMADLRPALINWGKRPDAFTAVLKCGALGWVSR